MLKILNIKIQIFSSNTLKIKKINKIIIKFINVYLQKTISVKFQIRIIVYNLKIKDTQMNLEERNNNGEMNQNEPKKKLQIKLEKNIRCMWVPVKKGVLAKVGDAQDISKEAFDEYTENGNRYYFLNNEDWWNVPCIPGKEFPTINMDIP